ncbi:MAG: hypothetical protein FWB85_02760 [Chitinispirillia bacterium]|nr:hypothetical protein [Chitinispirillia bacterium]
MPSALGLKNLADLVGWNVGYFFDTDASKSSLSGQETELVKVFRGLSIRGQTALMGAAYNIEEDEAQRGGGDVPPAGAASEPVSAAPKRGSAGALVGSDVGAGVRG